MTQGTDTAVTTGTQKNGLVRALEACWDVLFKIVSSALSMGVLLVSTIFFVPVFVAEMMVRLFKGKPPAEPDTEEIMVPVRKPRRRTIDIAKIDATFPAVKYGSLAKPNGTANKSTTTLVVPETLAKSGSGESPPPSEAVTIEPDKTCSVCLADFQPDSTVRQLTCQHTFHEHCLDQWFTKYHSHCPLCQLDFQDPENPQVMEDSVTSEFQMTAVTVTRAKKSEFWLGRWLDGVNKR